MTLISGGMPENDLDLGSVPLIQLPPVRSRDASFKILVNADGHPIDNHWRTHRRKQLLSAFDALQPHALLLESFPFGRRQMRFELDPLLERARASLPRPLIMSLVRDIVQQRTDSKRIKDTVELVQHYFDAVLVHGDPTFMDFSESFPDTHQIADKLHYTGFVVAETENSCDSVDAPDVLVSAGGGAVGTRLLETALQARPLTRWRDSRWDMLVGSQSPAYKVAELKAKAPNSVTVEHSRPDFRCLLSNCKLSVSQGGYNTVVELLQAQSRAVIVPFVGNGETEQSQRAAALAKRGLVQVVREQELTPERLAKAMECAMESPTAPTSGFSFDGARSSALFIAERIRHATDTC
ncbi:MAG: glycosyl transferase [Gammaproteobacteria bacterium]|nr:glycosyl transferase [Gammaproteobacteria bacterium]